MRYALLPRTVIALDGERRPHAFRIGMRPDGSLQVTASPAGTAARPPRSFVLALDPDFGFYRNAQAIPRGPGELAALAADMFPFDPATVAYCASAPVQGVRYHAVMRAELEALTGEWPAPTAIVIATADPGAILAAVTARIDRGAVMDLSPAPKRLLPPAAGLTAGLGVAAAAAGIGALMVWHLLLTDQQRELRRESARIEAEAAPILKQRQAIPRMVAALREQAAMARLPSGAAFEALAQALARLPNGDAIETIDVSATGVTVGGIGADAREWLAAAGVHTDSIKVETLLKQTQFRATLSAADAAAPTKETSP